MAVKSTLPKAKKSGFKATVIVRDMYSKDDVWPQYFDFPPQEPPQFACAAHQL